MIHLAVLILVLWRPAGAGDELDVLRPAVDSEAQVELTRQILEEEGDGRRRTIGLIRLRASYPQQISAGFGWMRTPLPANGGCRNVCKLAGPTFQVEPGLAGVQLSAGYAHIVGELWGSHRFLKSVFVGYGGKAVLLRTYGDSPLTPDSQTLIGAEGAFTVASANLSLGVLRSVSGNRDRNWIVTFGLGWGF